MPAARPTGWSAMREPSLRSRRRTHPKLRVAIVGAGNVGMVLGRVLREEGHTVTAVVSRTKRSAARAGRYIGCRRTSDALTAIPEATDVIFIASPHEVIPEVARSLALLEQFSFHRLAACHASGMLTADALAPLRERGAVTFSFHPLQTFPRDFTPRQILPTARGIAYGVDGDRAGVRQARRLASALRGRVFLVPPHMREFYHAVCVVASNHVTTLLGIVERLHAVFAVPGALVWEVFGPIMDAAWKNAMTASPAAALSGSIARGGVSTVKGHLEAMKRHAPDLMPYYLRMSLETVRLATAKGSLSAAQRQALEALLRSYGEVSPPGPENT
jgi:predicted short-subunit dehydrogenase-like oxidoreductase (DUF2520 family)